MTSNAVANDVREEAAEARAVGHEQRDVEEAGVALGGRRARLLDETHKRLVDAELGCAVLAREDAQADGVLPVRERAVEVGDAQLDEAHPGVGRDLHARDSIPACA